MESFAATLNINGRTQSVTILGVDVEFPDVLVSYIDANGNFKTESVRIEGRDITLGIAI